MRYFEVNCYEGDSLEELNCYLVKGASAVSSNLFFAEVHGEDRMCERVNYATAAFLLIAVCEAIAARVPEGEQDAARRRAAALLAHLANDPIWGLTKDEFSQFPAEGGKEGGGQDA